jgi:hypothetical protein
MKGKYYIAQLSASIHLGMSCSLELHLESIEVHSKACPYSSPYSSMVKLLSMSGARLLLLVKYMVLDMEICLCTLSF